MMVSNVTVDSLFCDKNFLECRIAIQWWLVCSPILIVVGTIGNLTAILVLSRKRMRNSTTSTYLIALACSDITVLYVGVLREWMVVYRNFDFKFLGSMACSLHVWALFTSAGISGWIITVLTLDRLLSIKRPIVFKTRCSRKIAMFVVGSLVLALATLNAHVFSNLKIYHTNSTSVSNALVLKCGPASDKYAVFFEKVWPFLVLILYSVIPLSILVVGNTCIISAIVSRNRKQKRQIRPGATANQQDSKDNQSVTVMLITICVFYFSASIGVCVYLILKPYIYKDGNAHDEARKILFWSITSCLVYINNAINFILYCSSSSLFRSVFKEMLNDVYKYFYRTSSLHGRMNNVARQPSESKRVVFN